MVLKRDDTALSRSISLSAFLAKPSEHYRNDEPGGRQPSARKLCHLEAGGNGQSRKSIVLQFNHCLNGNDCSRLLLKFNYEPNERSDTKRSVAADCDHFIPRPPLRAEQKNPFVRKRFESLFSRTFDSPRPTNWTREPVRFGAQPEPGSSVQGPSGRVGPENTGQDRPAWRSISLQRIPMRNMPHCGKPTFYYANPDCMSDNDRLESNTLPRCSTRPPARANPARIWSQAAAGPSTTRVLSTLYSSASPRNSIWSQQKISNPI